MLYLVVMEDTNGENQDCFVRADSREEAVSLALQNFDLETSEIDGIPRVFDVPPATGPKGALKWIGMGVLIERAS
jgi:hypothetical protein